MRLVLFILFMAVLLTSALAQRQVLTLSNGWRFHLHDVPGAEQPNFDDSGWQQVNVPHTWNNIDGQEGGNKYFRGIGWYRMNLTPPKSMADKSLFLRFEAAATVADVYVNGHQVGEHRGNFGAFCFEASPSLRPGQSNVIAVKVDNERFDDVPPLSGDFTIFGGIYRPVHLLALNKISIDPLDHASSGVYLIPRQITPDEAQYTVRTLLRNETGKPGDLTVRCVVTDASDSMVALAVQNTNFANRVVDLSLNVARPHFWNGVKDPYLYHATIEVLQGSRLLDKIEQPLGIRTFRVDPEEGFFLNGQHYDLHGVNRHQDRLNKGWAISAADHLQDYQLIREMGSTGIRLSHYQHAEDFYSLCDKGGLVVWAELPLINSLNYSPEFAESARSQLTELIKQNFNHPSILFWSLFNELHFPSGSKDPKDWALIVELNELAHRLDPSRLTTAATSLAIDHPVNFITDLIGVNRYYGWYSGKPEDWPRELDSWHAKFPNRAFAVSEYGAGASIHDHELDPKQPKADGPWHPEEWQSKVHEIAYDAMKSRHWLWGTFLWCMFDFASASRHEGDTMGRNDKGMVTYDRETKKDTFYFYQATWSSKPMAYLTDRRFSPRPSGPQTIEAYSNCQSLTLFLNGKSLGVQRSYDHVFLWQVNLAPGKNDLFVTSADHSKGANDRYSIQCEP